MTKKTSDCTHHYVIETPTGRTSPGTCKKCGATKVFNNS